MVHRGDIEEAIAALNDLDPEVSQDFSSHRFRFPAFSRLDICLPCTPHISSSGSDEKRTLISL